MHASPAPTGRAYVVAPYVQKWSRLRARKSPGTCANRPGATAERWRFDMTIVTGIELVCGDERERCHPSMTGALAAIDALGEDDRG